VWNPPSLTQSTKASCHSLLLNTVSGEDSSALKKVVDWFVASLSLTLTAISKKIKFLGGQTTPSMSTNLEWN